MDKRDYFDNGEWEIMKATGGRGLRRDGGKDSRTEVNKLAWETHNGLQTHKSVLSMTGGQH